MSNYFLILETEDDDKEDDFSNYQTVYIGDAVGIEEYMKQNPAEDDEVYHLLETRKKFKAKI